MLQRLGSSLVKHKDRLLSGIIDFIERKIGNYVYVTDFGAKFDGVTDDTYAFQQAIDTGKTVLLPKGDTVVGSLTIYPNTTIIGQGRRHGVKVTSGTQILFKGSIGDDFLTLKDVSGKEGDGQGTVSLKGFTAINASDYLNLPSPSSEQYYLYRPDVSMVKNGRSRGLFAVGNAHYVNWVDQTGWLEPKYGGVDCPFLMIDDVKFQNFSFALDVHSWMFRLSNFETYLCGTTRIAGTSLHATNCWPRNPLHTAYQLGVTYSDITSSSLGENVYKDSVGGGVECFHGVVSLKDVGYEQIRGIVINCYKGTVTVDNLIGVTGSTNKPSRLGKISGEDAYIRWENIPCMKNQEGEMIEFAFSMFSAISSELLRNHLIEGVYLTESSWIKKPYAANTSYSPFETAPYVTQSNKGFIGKPYVLFPVIENRLREVACMNVGYNNRVIIRGGGIISRFKIYGGFNDGITSASSTNPRQKHGTLKLKFTNIVSPKSDGVSSVIQGFIEEMAIFSFSYTSEGNISNLVHTQEVSNDDSKSIKVTATPEEDGGFLVEFAISRKYNDDDKFKQCAVDIDYVGSYPNNINNDTVSLHIG